ncbi:exopolysaccharide biosynthesis protein [Tateyamaria sp.]|uniref:exopolysaccharide biosynthesis protein n=1 Tax=Tateyamaria sp. TaxID=1929288 RepID=UPI00329AF398
MPDGPTLTHLLDQIDEAAIGEKVSVQNILDQIGDRSIMPVVLAIALVLVSPISGIPGFSTLSAFVILMVMVQALLPNRSLWLPRILRDRCVRSDRVQKAVMWLRKPTAWIDRHSHPRLRILTSGPLRWLTLVLCMLVPVMWPFMEFIPFLTSIGASAVALMSFGLLTRDGLYVIWGYGVVACLGTVILWALQAGT